MKLNVAVYRFVDLDRLEALRTRIDAAGRALGLRGTVLLAPEGINLFASGAPEAIEAFLEHLAEDDRLRDLPVKRSWSQAVAFDRWRVRLKKEIVTLRQPGIRPRDGRADSVAPETLDRWLQAGHDDDGRPLAIVDTRNRFEFEIGSFADAIDPGITAFSQLPQALEPLRPALAGKRVVTFCTGGIRCEKAVLYMARAGFEHVVQLDGGVLAWFERIGARHWRGDLFVFDKRVALDATLSPEVDAELGAEVGPGIDAEAATA
ncbi:MAG TPA: rhodanese-like domain-containing protein [Quisquiliibacterium sp.]|nr:rhodanese-like domain-containing protein [Quisquiliibacterium sp.]HQP66562.1 rhodanese-like domain-containing protein [Quisquiliibacterium sp.]